MSRKLSYSYVAISFILGLSIFVPQPMTAGGSGKGTSMVATGLGAVLVGVGMFGLSKDMTAASTDCGSAIAGAAAKCTADKWGMARDVLEMAGGAAAMMANSGNGDQVAADGTTAGAGGASGAAPDTTSGSTTAGLGDTSLTDMCTQMASSGMCTTNTPNGQPILTLPPLADMKAKLADGMSPSAIGPDGLSLQDALDKLDNNYQKAAEAVAAFNGASKAGDLPTGGNDNVAGDGSENGGKEGVGLDQGRGIASTSGDVGNEVVTLSGGGPPTTLNDLLDKMKKERGGPASVKANGLNLENSKDGRLLTIFERVTRAIRGTRDRDILLAKVEWSRKELMHKNQAPTNNHKGNLVISGGKN